MWELNYKESWALKNLCFWTVVLEMTLESPLDCKEIKPANPKGNQSWLFVGRTDAEAEIPMLWPPDAKSWLIWENPDAGKDWRQEKGTTEDEMFWGHHWLNGQEFGWTLGVGDGQGGLVCCGPWGCKELDTTEWLNWTEEQFLTPYIKIISKWIKDLNVRSEAINSLEENIGKTFSDINHSKILHDLPPRVMEIKVKINNWDLFNIKSFSITKETISKVKRQPSEWEKIIVNEATVKELISKIYKQLNFRKINYSIKKRAINLNRYFSKENIQMTNKHMKRCSTSFIIRDMHIKTTVGYHLTWVRMAAIKMSTNNKCWRGCGEKRTLLHCWWEWKLVQALWRTVWRFLKKLEIELPHDLAIPLLGLHTEETIIERDTCTPIFITALFTIGHGSNLHVHQQMNG